VQSDEDAAIYRRRFVPELLTSMHDSLLADGAARGLVLRTLCRAAAVPSLARQLASSSGAQHAEEASAQLDVRVDSNAKARATFLRLG
jgi:hypothetical protein